jgi:hypothetical protein
MWSWRIALCAALSAALTGSAAADPPVVFGFVEVAAGFAVRSAVDGAARRLTSAPCQLVLTDFVDDSGVTLSARLATRGKSVADYLTVVRFMNDSGAPQCRSGTLAFTQPGGRVVHVCGPRFADGFRRDRTASEIIVIHEMLHTMGLGENPPTSAAITRQVLARCGG